MSTPGGSGLGIDAVDVARFAAALARRPGLAARLFCDDELAAAGVGPGRAASLAARFAAKEATMKALGLGLGAVGFTDVAVGRARSGAPSLELSGRAAAAHHALGGGVPRVSLTHTATLAMAVVDLGLTR